VTDGMEISVDEVLAQLDELGRAKFDAALEKAKNRKLQARIDDLERQQSEGAPQ
jgi:hypothetical protein